MLTYEQPLCPGERDLDLEEVVAALRLPLPLGGLPRLSTDLEEIYGPGLRMIQRGGFLVILAADKVGV
jgi:hypothetical protein